ncbi:carboxymuconolactone decarboxylase family protein [Kitasatospora sp. NBC_01287]|uniref:carboxymuconolactone decarboxylase family protein n=1 Tax=Kitasatospora sp. NBC_01287 TaxID=2903573 RepID=UPI00224DF9AE|nr:carboxymuconolactone decarboxylase family protein [Kitasatospora sp. NBC_01287]MCX4744532.1 carboxymuconolactone decarboxylase family protein [Kitasatospora sp. NBC_01287]
MTNETVTEAPAPAADAPATRLQLPRVAPKVFKAVIALETAAAEGLDPVLAELVRIRASQLNGCAYCLHMHTSDARKAGESEERMHLVALWREAAHFFTAQEQAALALTEAVTLVAEGGVPDAVYARAAEHFEEPELAQLLGLILAINTWNRIAITSAKRAGTDERRP